MTDALEEPMTKKKKKKPKQAGNWVETPWAKQLREKLQERSLRRASNGKPLLVR
jgi:hypothetical protein